jgi:Ca2+-binding RTX toxin-like protein
MPSIQRGAYSVHVTQPWVRKALGADLPRESAGLQSWLQQIDNVADAKTINRFSDGAANMIKSTMSNRRAKKQSRRRNLPARRPVQFEALESRYYLASDWQNPLMPLDVNNDGFIAPIDALVVINDLNAEGPRPLPPVRDGASFIDSTGDGIVAPIDVLIVINRLNDPRPLRIVDITLFADTGASNTDLITSDARLQGAISAFSSDALAIKARFNDGPVTDVSVARDGTFAFDPETVAPLQDGESVFTVYGQDGDVDVFKQFRFHLEVNDAPVAPPLLFEVPNRVLGIPDPKDLFVAAALGPLQSATDPEGDEISLALDSGPSNGTLALRPDGSFTYAPRLGFAGYDSFKYSVSDGQATTIGVVTIAVIPVYFDALAITTPTPGVVRIEGTESDDSILVAEFDGQIQVIEGDSLDDPPVAEFNAEDVKEIHFYGHDGNDLFRNLARPSVGYGGSGDDTLIGTGGNSVFFGEDGNDLLRGSSWNDFLIGGAGDDTLFGLPGNDQVFGGPGDNTLLPGFSGDYFNYASEETDPVYVVDTLADVFNGDFSTWDLSFREAIELANAAPGTKTIRFSTHLTRRLATDELATIKLEGSLPRITADITIVGPGSDLLQIDAQRNSRIYEIAQNATVTISGMTLRNGLNTFGAALINFGNLTLNDVHGIGNEAPNEGSGISGQGGVLYLGGDSARAAISNSRFESNSSGGFGGVLFSDTANQLVTIETSEFTNNVAGIGGALADNCSRVTILGSQFTGNASDAPGGAASLCGDVEIDATTFAFNQSSTSGGAIHYAGAPGRSLTARRSTFRETLQSFRAERLVRHLESHLRLLM